MALNLQVHSCSDLINIAWERVGETIKSCGRVPRTASSWKITKTTLCEFCLSESSPTADSVLTSPSNWYQVVLGNCHIPFPGHCACHQVEWAKESRLRIKCCCCDWKGKLPTWTYNICMAYASLLYTHIHSLTRWGFNYRNCVYASLGQLTSLVNECTLLQFTSNPTRTSS